MMGWWDGTNFDAAVIAAFQKHHGPLPTVVRMTGSDLTRILQSQQALYIPSLSKAGVVKTTHQEHWRMINMLRQELPADLLQAPLTTAVVECLTRRAIARKWRASTLLKYLCTAQGALALLPLYLRAPAVLLNNCPVWRQALRGATVRAKQELPRQPKPASWSDVKLAIAREPSLPIRVAILLTWMTCARCGCVLQLQNQDVTIHQDTTAQIRFRKGKGARIRGPYTVHTTKIPQEYLEMVRNWLAARRSSLFPMVKGAQLKECLRRADPQLEQRSIRRGSLMTLSCTPGVTDSLLMEFSGHTQQSTLRRYLSWGTQAAHLRTTMLEAARTLTAPSISFQTGQG